MKFFETIKNLSEERESWVCVGLDIDPDKIPPHIRMEEDGIVEFGQEIIKATQDIVLCYKLNSSFFEAQGILGYRDMELILQAIPAEIPVILDAKRADIGNSSEQYARACFDVLQADAITVNPYLGWDALEPFLEYEYRGIFVLAVTSNEGAKDFQYLQCDGVPLYEQVVSQVNKWNITGNCGLVVGATREESVIRRIREIAPDLPFLVPGFGAQAGSLEAIVKWGSTKSGIPPIINSSRKILYASNGEDFAEAAREATLQLREAIHLAMD